MAQFTQNQRYRDNCVESSKSNSRAILVLLLTVESSLLFLPSSKFRPVDVAIFVYIIIFKNIVNYTGVVFSVDKFLCILSVFAMMMISILCKDSN